MAKRKDVARLLALKSRMSRRRHFGDIRYKDQGLSYPADRREYQQNLAGNGISLNYRPGEVLMPDTTLAAPSPYNRSGHSRGPN